MSCELAAHKTQALKNHLNRVIFNVIDATTTPTQKTGCCKFVLSENILETVNGLPHAGMMLCKLITRLKTVYRANN